MTWFLVKNREEYPVSLLNLETGASVNIHDTPMDTRVFYGDPEDEISLGIFRNDGLAFGFLLGLAKILDGAAGDVVLFKDYDGEIRRINQEREEETLE